MVCPVWCTVATAAAEVVGVSGELPNGCGRGHERGQAAQRLAAADVAGGAR